MTVIAQPSCFIHLVHPVIGRDKDECVRWHSPDELSHGGVHLADSGPFLRRARAVRVTGVVNPVEVDKDEIGHPFFQHPQRIGQHVHIQNLDSVQLIQLLKHLRDEKKFLCGEEISGEAPIFIGAVENPFADPFEFRVIRLAKKVKAGADFIQPQAIFDIAKFTEWMEMVTGRGLDKQVHILAGVIPIRSAGMARYMRDYVSGVTVTDEIVSRMEEAKDAKEEGLKIALEAIEQLKEIPGVHGIHIMAVGWEDIVPEIVEQAGLLPRPVL